MIEGAERKAPLKKGRGRLRVSMMKEVISCYPVRREGIEDESRI